MIVTLNTYSHILQFVNITPVIKNNPTLHDHDSPNIECTCKICDKGNIFQIKSKLINYSIICEKQELNNVFKHSQER